MELQFIEFEQGPREQTTDRIHVTITRRGEIFLNRRALEALGEPDSVALKLLGEDFPFLPLFWTQCLSHRYRPLLLSDGSDGTVA